MKELMPKPDLEHAVTIALKDYDEMEMILLKGHLILEQMLNHLLVAYGVDEKRLTRIDLMFAKTLELAVAMSGQVIEELYPHLKEINRIRNKLAHELFFEKYHVDLKKWASSVLGYSPKTINTKRTYKNHVIKALAFLAGALQGLSRGIEAVKSSNKRLHGTSSLTRRRP